MRSLWAPLFFANVLKNSFYMVSEQKTEQDTQKKDTKMKKKDMPLGIVVYRGPSLIDGRLVMAIATGFARNKNKKTGDMVQTWIMRADKHPLDALYQGADYSVCGDCKHRDFGSCYVNVGKSVSVVWKTYCRGDRYVDLTPENLDLFRGKNIRLGSYGDPSAVPIEVWNTILSVAKSHTGYTHRWKKCDQNLKYICMASCDTVKEAQHARALGWRTFRVRLDENDFLLEHEFVCPASLEGGHKIDCEHCGACSGAGNSMNPTIIVHGMPYKVNRFKEGIKKINNKKKWRTAKRV
jgi:hypothetical protein